MRALWLRNNTEGPLRALRTKDVHGNTLEFAPKGHAQVDATAFHDPWLRTMVARKTLELDFAYASSRLGGKVSVVELGSEAAQGLSEAGFSYRHVTEILRAPPSLVEARPEPTVDEQAAARMKAEAELQAAAAAAAQAAAEATARAAAEAAAAAAAIESAPVPVIATSSPVEESTTSADLDAAEPTPVIDTTSPVEVSTPTRRRRR